MDDRPEWVRLGDAILGPLLADTSQALASFSGADYHITQVPRLALHHLAHCLQTSIDTNRDGCHGVALSLLRQAVEALTIVELGLVGTDVAYRLLEGWDSGKLTHGNLRCALEKSVWPKYGNGLWDEPWSEFFTRLAKAVQPYAHCSPELIQWNLAVLAMGSSGNLITGAGVYDPTKASRLTLFHALVTWALGKILFANRASCPSMVHGSDVTRLGIALSGCSLLMKGQDWSVQLWPHLFFKE